VEFVAGNMLFVLLHELGHAAITEMGLPVLGRMEDAADSFAALRLIRVGSDFSHRVLIEAAKGWFLADLRDQRTGDKVQFYDEHGLNRQRAYEIVCLMVGSDQDKFKDLAKETTLPVSRQDTCAGDHSNAVYSWDLLLKPHLSPPDRPKTEIDAIYGLAQGRAANAQQALRSVRLLQTVAEHVANDYLWRCLLLSRCKAAVPPMPDGILRRTSWCCVTNSPQNSQISIVTMVGRRISER
jgi:Putative metallopeptidase